MLRLIVVLFLGLLSSGPAHAFGAQSGVFDDLEFVAETGLTDQAGAPLALCYTTDDLRLYGYTLSSTITGYALAPESCTTGEATPLSEAEMRQAQADGLIDADLPAVARNDLERNFKAYGIWVAIVLGLVAVIIRRIKSLLGLDLRGPMRKGTTKKILTAMCQVGQADGIIDSREVALIRRTAQRLTRRTIKAGEVVKVADHLNPQMEEKDYIALGRGLRDGEKDVMMRGAFYVALASGRLLPAEYTFLTNLAYGIGMPGEDFRRVMNEALTDLDTYPPA